MCVKECRIKTTKNWKRKSFTWSHTHNYSPQTHFLSHFDLVDYRESISCQSGGSEGDMEPPSVETSTWNPVHHRLMHWVCMRCGLQHADSISNKSSFLVQRKRLDNHQPLKWQLVFINSGHKVLSNDPGYQSVAAGEASGILLAWLAEVAKIHNPRQSKSINTFIY